MISVCMGIYNGAAYIRAQLQSILDQTLPPDEVVLCDDGSTDGSEEIVERFILENGLEGKWKLFCNRENKGYPANFYSAMDLCLGDYVFLADQDDIWDEKKLEHMTAVMEEKESIKVLSCKFGLIDEKGIRIHTMMQPSRTGKSSMLRSVNIADVFYKCEWPGMVMAYRRLWYENKLGQWRDKVNKMQEYPGIPHDFLLCAWAAEEQGFCQLDEELAWHRRHDNNAGKEEHRLAHLINKERKVSEIKEYLRILGLFESWDMMQTARGYQALMQKEAVMKERLQALDEGKVWRVLQNAWKNRKHTRIVTAVCDLAIALKRSN